MEGMENYEKKEVVKNFAELDSDVVKCGQHGKLHGYVHFSKKQLKEKQTVTISGIGKAINKAVSTAELLKKDLDLHQTNKIYFVTITEIWTPKDNQNLQNIEVERKVPAISIKLDIEEPSEKGPGYQPPDLTSPPDKPIPRQKKFKKFNSKPKEKDDYPFPHHQKRLEEKFKPVKERNNRDRGQQRKNGKKKTTANSNVTNQSVLVNENSSDNVVSVNQNNNISNSNLDQDCSNNKMD